jgi:hypothetical protein
MGAGAIETTTREKGSRPSNYPMGNGSSYRTGWGQPSVKRSCDPTPCDCGEAWPTTVRKREDNREANREDNIEWKRREEETEEKRRGDRREEERRQKRREEETKEKRRGDRREEERRQKRREGQRVELMGRLSEYERASLPLHPSTNKGTKP